MRVTAPSPLSATQTAVSPTATAPGSEPTSIGAPLRSPLSRSIRVTASSAALATQTVLLPASIPPGLAADFDRVAEHGVDRGVDLGDGVGAAVGDPDEAVGDGDAGGAAADRDRGVDAEGAEVDAAHAAGRGAADPEAALPDREPQRLPRAAAGRGAAPGRPWRRRR